MPIIRYGKTGLLGQVTPTYTPPQSYTPTYTPSPPPTYTPTYTPVPPQKKRREQQYTPPGYTPTYTPIYRYTPTLLLYQGTPSYAPPPTGTPTEINPEEAGLYPEGALPPQLVYAGGYGRGGAGGAFGPSIPEVEEPQAEIPEEPKKTSWLLWLALAAGVYMLLGGRI